jgi:hypothetical protein
MLNNLRNKLPEIEEAGDAALNRVVSAANSAAQTARDASGHLEGWAKDGLDSMKMRPFMWGTASLGVGALLGGLFALWRKPKPARVNKRAPLKTMPARVRTKQALRATVKPNGAATAESKPRKKRARKATPPQSAENA